MILDTSVLIDLLSGDQEARSRVADLESTGALLWVPAPAIFELYEGIERADRPEEERSRVEAVVSSYTVLGLSPLHAKRAGTLSGKLVRRGEMLDPVDVQVAGMALAEGRAVLTRDTDDFDRVADLEVDSY